MLNTTQFPLFTFNSIIDLDFGLVNLIKENFMNTDVFNTDFFNQDLQKCLNDLCLRENKNPLYLMTNKNVNSKDLDEYYSQFLEEEELIQFSFYTNVFNLLLVCKNNDNFNPTLLYFNEGQKRYIENNDELKGIHLISVEELEESKKHYDFIFIKDLDELQYFLYSKSTLFYVAKLRYNFDKNDVVELNEDNSYYKLILSLKRNNKFAIYDLYKTEEKS